MILCYLLFYHHHLGYQKNITCDFSINSCAWVTEFHVQNSQISSLSVDYNTDSLHTGKIINVIQLHLSYTVMISQVAMYLSALVKSLVGPKFF